MSAKIKDTDEDLGDLQVIPDFLPSPEELALKEDNVKITTEKTSNKTLNRMHKKRRAG